MNLRRLAIVNSVVRLHSTGWFAVSALEATRNALYKSTATTTTTVSALILVVKEEHPACKKNVAAAAVGKVFLGRPVGGKPQRNPW